MLSWIARPPPEEPPSEAGKEPCLEPPRRNCGLIFKDADSIRCFFTNSLQSTRISTHGILQHGRPTSGRPRRRSRTCWEFCGRLCPCQYLPPANAWPTCAPLTHLLTHAGIFLAFTWPCFFLSTTLRSLVIQPADKCHVSLGISSSGVGKYVPTSPQCRF